MTKVSIRELKDHLSEYIDRASRGEEITVTRRGQAVAKVSAARAKTDTIEDRLRKMEEAGILKRGKGKLRLPDKLIPLQGEGPSVSEMVLADRGEPIP